MLRHGSWFAFGAPGVPTDVTDLAATVVCRSMGFVGDGAAVLEDAGAFGAARIGAFFHLRYCEGAESSPLQCLCEFDDVSCFRDTLYNGPTNAPLAVSCPAPKGEPVISTWLGYMTVG